MNNFMEALVPLIAIIFTFGIPGLIIFWYLYNKHRERMKLIDMGLTPEEVKSYFRDADKKPRSPYSALKWGIILTFIGIGFIVSMILENVYDIDDAITPAILILSAGLAFLVYYMLVKSKVNGNGIRNNPPANS